MRSRRYMLFSFLLAAGYALPAQAQTNSRGVETLDPTRLIGFGTVSVVAGEEIFVSRPGDFSGFPMPGSEAGSVHVFRQVMDSWEEVASIPAPSGTYGDGFGLALDVEGQIMIVGAPKENEARGAAYVFVREKDTWTNVDRLEATDGMPGDGYGSSISLEPGIGLIGAPGRGTSGTVFGYFAGEGGVNSMEFAASDAPADARFGASISLDGDLAVIGAPGPFSLSQFGPRAAFQPGGGYVFRRNADSWEEVTKLSPGTSGSAGLSVLLIGGEALLSAPIANQGAGTILRFESDAAGTWSEIGTIDPAGSQGGLFGFAMGRAGERLVVGSPNLLAAHGGASVWTLGDDGQWSVEATLDAETTGLMGFLGNSVAGSEDLIVVGAPGSEFFEGIGFVFSLGDDGTWTEETSIHETDFGLDAVTGGEQRCEDEGSVAGFACQDVELVSFLPVHEVGGDRGIMVSDIWGWTDPQTGREYAILGRFNGTSFIDVTDAENPRYLGNLPLTEGATANLWRDMKVYDNHTFVVADNAGEHGIQVFDLTRLRDVVDAPVEFTEDAHYSEFFSAHNIVINEESGFAYVVGGSGGGETCGGALHMVDLRDPKNPTFAGCYSDPNTGQNGPGYTHDAQCVMYRGPDADHAGKEVCFNASESALGIGDVSDKDNPTPISSAAYPNVGYSHQGWLSEDHRFFYLNDELDELQGLVSGTRTLVWDVEDLDDPVLVNEFVQDNPASDHNLYVRGQFMYQSNYVSGLRIFDISDPANPTPVGFFDTVTGSPDGPGFAGSWSNYPFFDSGNIIVSSMREGLFVLKKRQPELVP